MTLLPGLEGAEEEDCICQRSDYTKQKALQPGEMLRA